MSWFDFGQALAGGITGLFKGAGQSIGSSLGAIGGWLASQAGAKQTQKYNLQNMEKQYDYSTKLMGKQYRYAVHGQQHQYKYAKALQNQQMNFEKMMSSTAHQREVEDLRKAGLNPILSANGGASTPSVGAGSIGMASVAGQSEGLPSAPSLDYAQQIQNAISNAFEKRHLDNETQSVLAEVTKKDAETKTESAKLELVNQEKTLKQSEELLNRQTLEYLPSKQRAELEQMYALTKAQTASANLAQVQARNSIVQTEADKILKEAQTWRYKNESLGYHTSVKGLGFGVDHTGNPNFYTKNKDKSKQEKRKGHWEKIKKDKFVTDYRYVYD